jgi:hypothetical protein
MPEKLTSSEQENVDLLNLQYSTRRALGGYALSLRQAREAQDQLQRADQVIEIVNAGLPEGVKVGTNSSFSPEADRYDRGGYNKIYRPDNTGNYVVVGEICTEGAQYPFLGDRLVKLDEGLVIVNDELQLGFSAKEEVFIVDTSNDPSERTLGGSRESRFLNQLIPCIESVPFGEKVAFDSIYN